MIYTHVLQRGDLAVHSLIWKERRTTNDCIRGRQAKVDGRRERTLGGRGREQKGIRKGSESSGLIKSITAPFRDETRWVENKHVSHVTVHRYHGMPPTPAHPCLAACSKRARAAASGGPYGTRTRVSALRGLHPGPLDEWADHLRSQFGSILSAAGCFVKSALGLV